MPKPAGSFLTSRRGQALACAALFLLCLSCIPVEDLGVYWDKGIVDPDLEGNWKQLGVENPSQDKYVSFKKAGTYYESTQIGAEDPQLLSEGPRDKSLKTQVRTLIIGKHRFMMFRESIPASLSTSLPASSQSNMAEKPMMCGLIRYTIENEQLVIYALNEPVFSQAIRSGRIDGKVPSDAQTQTSDNRTIEIPRLTKLDEKTIQVLGQMADDASYWKSATTKFGRVDNLSKALETSRRYPATQDTAENSRMHIDLPDLKYLAEDKQGILIRHLQASPEWDVFKEGTEVVAYRRKLSGGQWDNDHNAYYQTNWETAKPEETRWQIRYMFRFSANTGGPFARLGFLTRADPLAGDVQLKLKGSDQGIESCLAVGQGSLWFEFFEQASSEPRVRTRDALKWLAEFLSEIRKSEDEIVKNGYAAKLMPEGSIKKGKPSIEVTDMDDSQGGFYSVHAWVNPGSDGETFLKVFDVKTGARLSTKRIIIRLTKHIGWSKDPESLFLYNDDLIAHEGDWDHSYEARFELWFKDSKSGTEKKLVEVTRNISGWKKIER